MKKTEYRKLRYEGVDFIVGTDGSIAHALERLFFIWRRNLFLLKRHSLFKNLSGYPFFYRR